MKRFILLIFLLFVLGCEPLEKCQCKYAVFAFTATWCEERDKELLDSISTMRGVSVIKIDIDKHPDLAKRHGITSIPFYMVVNIDNPRTVVLKTGSLSRVASLVGRQRN